MQTEPAFTETELARRWNVSIKTLQRWRSEERGPPYIKLSKAVRYPVDEIVTYEQAIREGMKPLRLSGALKVAAGITTLAEVVKVAPPAEVAD